MTINEMHNSKNSLLNVLADQIIDDGLYDNELYEKSVAEYLDPKLRRFSRTVAEAIVNYNDVYHYPVKIRQYFRNEVSEVNDIERIIFQNTGLEWIDELNLYVEYDSYSQNKDDEDFLVVTNTSTYVYDININVIREYNIEFEIRDMNGNLIPLFLFDGQKIRTASILIHYCPKLNYSVQHYAYAISHELSHIYNLLEKKQERQNELNRDKNYLDVSKKHIRFENNIVDNIAKIIVDNIYVLNESEIEARVFNFLDDISKNTPEETGLFDVDEMSDEELCKKLSQYSNIFKDYYLLYTIFEKLMNKTSVDLKCQFAEKWIKGLFAKRDADGRFPFSRDFCVQLRYDENSFDLFFSIMRENIKKLFLDNACSIFRELKTVTESIVKRKCGILFEGLYGQNYMLKYENYKRTLKIYKNYTLKHIGCIDKYFKK